MTKTQSVKGYTRRVPEQAPDPFAPALEARSKDFARKWNVELVGSNDDRLSVPIADPVPGPGKFNEENHNWLMKALAVIQGRR